MAIFPAVVASLALLCFSLYLASVQGLRIFQNLRKAGRDANDIALSKSPTRLSALELASITLAIVAKYARIFTGKTAHLQADPTNDQLFTWPLISLHGLINLDDGDFKKFDLAVSPPASTSQIGAQVSPMFLIATTGPLVPFMLALPACPIKPLGAVNTHNEFAVLDPAFCRSIAEIKAAASAGSLSYTARFGGPDSPGRRKKRGVEFSISIDILRDHEVVLTQNLHFLQFLAPSAAPKYKPATTATQPDILVLNSNDEIAERSIKMNTGHPWKWAACCRDYNPIHISKFMAKLFGFKSVIAHGNHVVALAVQQLSDQDSGQRQKPESVGKSLIWESLSSFTIDVKFAKPTVLPVNAQIKWWINPQSGAKDETRVDFVVYKAHTQYTVGSCSTTSSTK